MTFPTNLIFLTLISKVWAIWPPPYEINLHDGETFLISEFSNGFISDEDEMIPVKSSSDKEKYFKIHQMALRHNKRELERRKVSPSIIRKIPEHNFDMDDPIPWEGGFVDKNGNFIQPDNENVYYLNEMAKSLIDNKIKQKRENEQGEVRGKDENYDYNGFKKEYNAEVAEAKTSKDTLNFTDVKEDEGFADAVETVVEFKDAKNCSAEEMRGIGVAAIKCIVTELKTPKSKDSLLNLLEKILRITLIWFCVYAVIAIPCWCTRGWCCCCCCCCKICRPRQTIDEAKRFYTQNPVGVFREKGGKKIQYEPTQYEIYTQEELEKALFNL